MSGGWTSTGHFAEIAGISGRAARKALERTIREHTRWRGHMLEARVVNGRGGDHGKSYIAKVSSLPLYLQERLKALQSPVGGRSMPAPGSDAARERTRWLHILGPALEHPLDVRGAQETATRQKAHRQAIRALDRSAPDIPLAERLIGLGLAHEDVIPNPPVGNVTYDPANRPARAVAPRSKEARDADVSRREADEILELRMKLLDRKAG